MNSESDENKKDQLPEDQSNTHESDSDFHDEINPFYDSPDPDLHEELYEHDPSAHDPYHHDHYDHYDHHDNYDSNEHEHYNSTYHETDNDHVNQEQSLPPRVPVPACSLLNR